MRSATRRGARDTTSEERDEMSKEAEELVLRLKGKYRVRDSFIGEIAPLVEKIYSGRFNETKRAALLTLAEDAFRREQEIFDQQIETAKALDEMSAELRYHYQQVESIQKTLSEAVQTL